MIPKNCKRNAQNNNPFSSNGPIRILGNWEEGPIFQVVPMSQVIAERESAKNRECLFCELEKERKQ